MCQAPNLERMLGTSRFQSEQTINTVNKCDKNCYCRPDSLDKSTSKFKKSSKAFKIQTGFSWESKILLYLICRGCKVEYIDESRCMLKERLDPIKCWGINLTPPVVFPKMYLPERERVKPCFFVTFSIPKSHTCPENFIQNSSSPSENMKIVSVNINYFHQLFGSFDIFLLQRM